MDRLKDHFYVAVAPVEGVEPLGDYRLCAAAERDAFGISYATEWMAVKSDASPISLDGYQILCEDDATTVVVGAGREPIAPGIFTFLINDFRERAVQCWESPLVPITARLEQRPRHPRLTANGLLEEPSTHTIVFDDIHDRIARIKARRVEGLSDHEITYRRVGSSQLAAASLKTILAVTRGYPELRDMRERLRA